MFHKVLFSHINTQDFQGYPEGQMGGKSKQIYQVNCFPFLINWKGGELDSRFKNLRKEGEECL
jgi:hypothetical protein